MRALLLLGALGGCAGLDPLTRAGVWRPIGANEANLQAMVANPYDLTNGAASPVADGTIAADAVARYRAGKVRPLQDSGIALLTTSGAGAAPAAAGLTN